VVSHCFPALVVDCARAVTFEILCRAHFFRVGIGEGWGQARAGDLLLRHAFIISGARCQAPPIRWHQVDGMDEMRAHLAAGGDAFGQLIMNGSAMPPLKTLRFQRLKGVLPAIVQPVA